MLQEAQPNPMPPPADLSDPLIIRKKPLSIKTLACVTILESGIGLAGLLLLLLFGLAFSGSGLMLWLFFLGVAAYTVAIPTTLSVLLLNTHKIKRLLLTLNLLLAFLILNLVLIFALLTFIFNSGVNDSLSFEDGAAGILLEIARLFLVLVSFRNLYKQGVTTSPYPFAAKQRKV